MTHPAQLTRRQRRTINRAQQWHDAVGKDAMGRPIYPGRPDERRANRSFRKRWGLP